VDLFCGPGAYNDGTDSTPLLVIDRALENPTLLPKLTLLFNDKEPDHVAALAQRLSAKSGIDRFIQAPRVTRVDMVDERALRGLLDSLPVCPTFYFVDPFGYKGLTRSLLQRLMSGEGAECLFFFNYRRINAALNNPLLGHYVDSFFGHDAAERLRRLVDGLDPGLRERLVMDVVQDLVQSAGALVPLTFRICSADCDRTSHYLVFATKHFKGYSTMREVMAKECVFLGQDVPLYEYDPKPEEDDSQLRLWEDPKPDPFEPLRSGLLERFGGRTYTVERIFELHSIGTPFIMRHYKAVLRSFEAQGLVSIDPPADQRPKNTLRDTAVVTFPVREVR
jgi:three-Cys-motif partner protein